jgi:flagellar hook-basal body complex protein FliE
MVSNKQIKNKTKRFRSKIKGGGHERELLDAIKHAYLDKVNTLLNKYENIVRSVDTGGLTFLHHVCIQDRKSKVDKKIAFALRKTIRS